MSFPLLEAFIRVTKFKINMEKKKQLELKKERLKILETYEIWLERYNYLRRYMKNVPFEDSVNIVSEPLDLSEKQM